MLEHGLEACKSAREGQLPIKAAQTKLNCNFFPKYILHYIKMPILLISN